ncbi:acetyl-CoA synthetase-like protein [Microthyrium microscopicum]|uniref:Acetyl-CoA synthetase-like protein n=1 Tax=Microthyrium microscopicum TaxID=703497 RepID=A0A6A6U1S3_9PEZI|nr:acetyl-CoA synthetase-like protein [Microthyrium microscopicum]
MSIQTETIRDGSSIIYRCNTTYDIPKLDILTLLFESKHSTAIEQQPLHVDAENPNLKLTKAETRDLTKRVAHSLRHRYGVGAGTEPSYVTCIASGSYVMPTMFYGVLAAGGIFSSVSSSSTVDELVRLIKGAPSDVVIYNEDTKDVVIAAAKECGIPADRLLLIDAPNVALRESATGKDVLTSEMLDWKRITSQKELESTPSCLIYSSGTTGLPKGVTLSHMNMVAEVFISCQMQREQIFAKEPNFKYTTLAHLPVAHIAGMQGYFVNPVFMGGTTYWMPKFDFLKFLEYNRRYKISIFFTVPPIYLLIAKTPEVTDQFDHLRVAYSGAAPMKKELQEAASKKFGKGKVFIMQTWGLSESTGSTTLLNVDEKDELGSVSRLLPNMSARIVDEQGQDVGPGEEGEIYLKGPVIFNSYHKNPGATAETFDRDGWFKTGDVGCFKDGLLFIVDRKKELIKYKGMQVAPAELEGLLLSHPEIADAAVIGVEWEGTEAPRAYVVADKNRMTPDRVKQFVKDKMSSHKQLRGGVVYLDAIPKSPSGKILRKDLRALVKKEEAAMADGKARL